MYKISDFSQIGQVSVRMLRHYDKLGLLKPNNKDKWTNYRYYTLDQLPRLHQILALRDLGLSLEQIRGLLDDPGANDLLYEMLQVKQRDIEDRLAEEQARLDRVAARLALIERVHAPIPYDVALKALPAQHVAAVREVVPHLSQIGRIRERMLASLYDALALARISPGMELAIYHQQAYSEEDIDMSLAVEVADGVLQNADEVLFEACTLPPAPLAASVVYNGSMRNIPDVVVNLYRWLGMNGYTSAGAYREVHLFGRELDVCASGLDQEVVIEVLVPVEKL